MEKASKRLATEEGLQAIADAIKNTETVQMAKAEIQAEGETQVANVQAVAQEITDNMDITLPQWSYVFYPVLSGVRTDIYFDNLCDGMSDMYIGAYSGNANNHARSMSIVPDDSYTNETLYCSFRCNIQKNTYKTGAVKIKLIKNSLGSGKTPRVLLIGDSHTAKGIYQKYANDVLTDGGITVTWIGTKTSSYGLRHEGRSGWRAYTWANCANGSSDVSNIEATSNPFINNGVFDFANYMTVNGYNGVDIVFINLGTNDLAIGSNATTQTMISAYNKMINSIQTYDSNIKIVLWICPPPCSRNGVGASYQSWYRNYQTREALFNQYRKTAWGVNNIYLLPVNLGVDPIYDFPSEEVSVSPYNTTETIIEATDITHLSDAGYRRLANPISGVIKYLASITENISVTGITLSETSGNISVDETITVTANVIPTNAANKEIEWSSNNTSIATVVNGVITGIAEGTAIITATTKDGGYQATYTINVTAKNELTNSIDKDGSIYNSVGYKYGYQIISGTGEEGSHEGTSITGFIPITHNKTLNFSGFDTGLGTGTSNPNYNYLRMALYDNDFNLCWNTAGTVNACATLKEWLSNYTAHSTMTVDENGYMTSILFKSTSLTSNLAYVRLTVNGDIGNMDNPLITK